MDWLGTAGSILNLANSAKSLFGGSKDEGDSMKSQYAWNAYSALMLPQQQVAGLRKAGLNPMLAVGKGIQSPPPITSSPGADDQQRTNRANTAINSALAMATTANQNAQADLYRAQAENTKAQTATEQERPDLVRGQAQQSRSAALLADIQGTTVGQQGLTETERTKLVKAEAFLKDFEAQVVKQYGPAKADLIFRQIKAATQMSETEATSAKGIEDAYKNIPPELVGTIRILRSIFSPGSPGRYFNQ